MINRKKTKDNKDVLLAKPAKTRLVVASTIYNFKALSKKFGTE